MNFYSPLRYPGGKGKLANFFKTIFDQNLLLDGYYIEPYAGGASISLALLFNEYANHVIINDFDKSIYAFWYVTLYRTDEFCDLIKSTKIDLKTWLRQKEVQKNKRARNLLELGLSTFYLNRTNISGIINGGIIGGLKQNGLWKMGARFNKDGLIARIQRIAEYKDRITLYNMDACKLIKKISSKLPKKSLFYLDPPYYIKGSALYVNYYKKEDHCNIANVVRKYIKRKWVVSYDYTPEISSLYPNLRKRLYSINYSAAIKRKGTEMMIFSDDLLIPKSVNFKAVK